MRVLVTGATGMVGANLVPRLLERGDDVSVVSRSTSDRTRLLEVARRLRWLTGDLTDESSMLDVVRQTRPDVVYHLASTPFNPPTTPPRTHAAVNVLGTMHLLEAIRAEAPGARLVFTGSAAVYAGGHRLSEDAPLAPGTVLGATKAAASVLLNTYARLHGLGTVELRLFTPYGPWEHPRRLVPSAILAALDGRDVEMTRGDQQRDFVFVEDVVEALLTAAERDLPAGSVYNIGSGIGTPVHEVAALAVRLMGDRVVLRRGAVPARPDEIMEVSADIRAAREGLGWVPRTDLESGLRKTIAWFGAHRDLAPKLT